jgi:oligosaccharide repeat unit polymerase
MLLSEPRMFRGKSEIPVFCKPIPLFLFMWTVMLVSLEMHVTVYTYPHISLAFLLFLCSTLSLFAGFLIARLFFKLHTATVPEKKLYQVNLIRLRHVEWFLILVIAVILVANYISYGPPPLFSVLGATTLNYVEYGKLKQVLNAATMALTVTISLETAWRRKALLYSLTFFSMIAYATRGFLLFMLTQAFFVFCLQTKTSKRKLYAVAMITVITAVTLSNLIGNGRAESTSEAFVAFFGITDTYAKWPMATLWILSYVSTPISNICWIVHSYHYIGPSATFLATLLPAFWAPESLETQYLGSTFIIDGVHTYLAKYFLDLWYFGIVLINAVWGIIAAQLMHRNRLARKSLTSAVLLGAIVFIFFADYLTFLSVFMELAVLVYVERYALLPQ